MRRELVLELGHFGPEDKATVLEYGGDGSVDLGFQPQILGFEVDEGNGCGVVHGDSLQISSSPCSPIR